MGWGVPWGPIEEDLPAPEWPGDEISKVISQVVRAEARQTRNLIRRIMSDVQQHLDSDTTALADSISALEAEITSLKAQTGTPVEQVDFTKLDALVASLKVTPPTPGEVAAAAATVDAAPPSAPVADATPDAGTSPAPS